MDDGRRVEDDRGRHRADIVDVDERRAGRGRRSDDGGRRSDRRGRRCGRSSSEGRERLEIDDPVSKWWVGLIVVVFVAIFGWAILLGQGGLLSGLLAEQRRQPESGGPSAAGSRRCELAPASPGTATTSPSASANRRAA